MARALLVPGEDVADGRPARDRVVRRQDRAARNAERDVDALGLEAAQDGVGAEHSRHAHASLNSSTSVRFSGSSASTASVNVRVPGELDGAAATARSSVRAPERR